MILFESIEMELHAFEHSLMNKSICLIVKDESECYIPWEFLHAPDAFSHKLLITNKTNKYKNLVISNEWNSVWNIGSQKDWSCIATTLKAHSGHLLLVFDVNCPERPTSFLNFIQNLIDVDHKSITRIEMIKLGQHIGFYDTLFWSAGHDSKNIYNTIVHFVSNNSHVRFDHDLEMIESFVNAANKEHTEIVMSYEGTYHYRLYWSRREDSFLDHSEIIKKAYSYIRSSMNTLDSI